MMRNWAKFKLALRHPAAARERFRAWYRPKRRIARLVRKKKLIAPPPITVSINLTHLCNLRCKMCGQWRRRDIYRKEILPLAKLKELIDDVGGFKPKIYLWGGEPLLYPEIGELLRYLREKKQYVILNTNGVLLERYAEAIVNSGVNGLDISLDGPAAIHDEIRQVEGTFEKVMAGVRRVKMHQKKTGRKDPMMKVVCTISEMNQSWLVETLELVEASGLFDALIFNLGWFTTEEIGEANRRVFRKYLGCDSLSWKEFVGALGDVDPEKIKRLREEISCRRKGGALPVFFIPPIPPAQIETYYSRPALPLGKKICFSPWLNPDIRPNGDVTFCADFPDYIIGNINEKPFREIWNGEKAKKFRRVLIERGLFPICSRCCGLYAY